MNQGPSLVDRVIRFCLEQKLVVILIVLMVFGWGVAVAPFGWKIDWLPRRPVPVDAIPNLGENQQIVFTDWPGRSPQDVENQVTYPLTAALLGVPGVKEVRSLSMFGFSSIFLIFEEGIEFYWSRARIIERLNSLPAGSLPEGVQPGLGPDATALGQVYWYTLEGRDPDGNPTGGWDLHELRTVQDWYVRFGLLSAEGISEVASIGGFVREYQVDVNPDALRAYGATLGDVQRAVRMSNLDVGARTTEINRVEYLLRGVGFVKGLEDLEQAVVRVGESHVPIRVRDVANVALGPAERRGALTQAGAEAVGGVVVVREGYNPLEAIHNVKAKIAEISPGLPTKAVIDWTRATPEEAESFAAARGFRAFDGPVIDQQAWRDWLRANPRESWPAWATLSQLTIVPFYDRTGLIHETLATLNDALVQETLVTVLVVIVMLLHLRTSIMVSATLPLSVLMCFIVMKAWGVNANVVSLAGIAIAIGTIVDMGLIVSENIVRRLDEAPPEEPRLEVIYRGASEVGSAVLTAILTTVVSFLPVFTMTGAEGKMFKPLAFTKTFVLLSSVVLALTIVPTLAHLLLAGRPTRPRLRVLLFTGLALVGVLSAGLGWRMGWSLLWPAGLAVIVVALFQVFRDRLPRWMVGAGRWVVNSAAAVFVAWILAGVWEPLGPAVGAIRNFVFVAAVIGGVLGLFWLFKIAYTRILRWCLDHKALFLSIPLLMVAMGATVWLGFDRVFGFIPALVSRIGLDGERVRLSAPWVWARHEFPGLGREFMPPLDEGSFLWMPTTMPHASLGEALEVVKHQDLAISSVPEVESVTGKIGRVESALDPAPISMIETVILYKPEYISDESGRRINYRYDRARGEFVRDEQGRLIPDDRGRPFRQWRDHIRRPADIWNEIVKAAHLPGTTSAPRLQPIETRLVMLQTGMRAPMGVKLRAPDLDTLDRVAVEFERALRRAPSVEPDTVNAERVIGKPYLEIEIDRSAIARYGLNIVDVQETITAAIGGDALTTTVEGRERYPVRVRYPRELRGEVEQLARVLVAGMDGVQAPLAEVARIRYERGPQMIRSEDTFLTAYITFGGKAGLAEVDVVESAQAHLRAAIERGDLHIPPGVSYRFAGAYEHQQRAAATLRIVLPVSLFIIFLILYLQFRSVITALIVFSGIAVAWAGGFVAIWLYGQDWFANFGVFGVNMRETFQLRPISLSVAVWVGFLALFGIAVDDGVVMATYLKQSFAGRTPESMEQIRGATVAAGSRRVRPCLMTAATTILALLPVLTSTGRGADVMIPMAIPSLGGMTFVLITMFTVPVLYCLVEERKRRVG